MQKAPDDPSGAFIRSAPRFVPRRCEVSCETKHPHHAAKRRPEAAAERGVTVQVVAAPIGTAGGPADNQIGKHGMILS